MSSKGTEEKLIRIISEHYLDGGRESLTIQVASKRAGISRQAFSRYYGHLKPYVLGKRPVEELMNGSIENVRGLLTKCQYRVRGLQEELEGVRAECNETIEKARVNRPGFRGG